MEYITLLLQACFLRSASVCVQIFSFQVHFMMICFILLFVNVLQKILSTNIQHPVCLWKCFQLLNIYLQCNFISSLKLCLVHANILLNFSQYMPHMPVRVVLIKKSCLYCLFFHLTQNYFPLRTFLILMHLMWNHWSFTSFTCNNVVLVLVHFTF